MSAEHWINPGLRIIRTIIKISSLLLGLTLVFVAVWAVRLGIDNNTTFGPRRWGMLFLGTGFVLWAIWDWINPKLAGVFADRWSAEYKIEVIEWIGSIGANLSGSNSGQRIRKSARRLFENAFFSWMKRHWLAVSFIVVAIMVTFVYFWIFSTGRMVFPTAGTRYYSWLADAFRERQVHLLTKPSPGLLSLPNPYDHHLRKGVNYIWDASLYDGKYFLYWGPVPGLIVSSFQVITSELIRDSYLVFGFVIGAFLFSALMLSAIWRRFQNILPGWGYLGGLLALGLNVPMIWLLTRPAVYEASIAGGQFFLMAGLYWGFLAISRPKMNYSFLALAGIAWALTAGTRINLIPAILFLGLMVAWRVYQKQQSNLRLAFAPMSAFLLPLILGGGILAGYNYVRFGSIFEFGHRYQLTGPALPGSYDSVTASAYSIPNLYNYIFRFPSFSGQFPFITIPWEKSWPFFIQLPSDFYSAEPVAGLLWLVPVTGLALIIFFRYLWLTIDQSLPPKSETLEIEDRSLLGWLQTSLVGSGILQLTLLLVFISSSLRYLADITLIAILLSTIYLSQISAGFNLKKIQRGILASLWLGASGLTSILAVIVNISGYELGFQRNNPALYHLLLRIFQ